MSEANSLIQGNPQQALSSIIRVLMATYLSIQI